MSTIASQYNITLTELTRHNKISKTNHISVGKFIKIPNSGTITASATPSTSSSKEKMVTYRVRQGDSLWTLAKRYNTTSEKIQRLNNLNSLRLTSGQSLKIPSSQSSRSDLKTYKVKNGDSVAEIASKHKMDLGHLLSLNNLKKNSTIYPGQRLYVK